MLDFWKRIKFLMEAQKLTHANVEEAIGASPSQMSAWINNDRLPRVDYAHRLAKYFHVSLEWLVTGEDEKAVPVEYLRLLRNKTLLDVMKRIEKANMMQTNAIIAILDAFEL